MIENEGPENENLYDNNIQINTTTEQNTIVYDNQSENTENQKQNNGDTQENTLVQNPSIDLQSEKLDQIHQDLGFICSFLIIFVLVIVFRYIYKFFDIFFKI